MGRSWEFWNISTGNVGSYGNTIRCECSSLGTIVRKVIGFLIFRPAMIKYNINNIRSLIGNRIDLENIKISPPCLIKDA